MSALQPIIRRGLVFAVIPLSIGPANAQDHAIRIKGLNKSLLSRQSETDRFRIIYPPDFSPDYKLTPVVYALHGYGGNMNGMEQIWKEPCARLWAILVVLQGSQNPQGGGFSWSGPEDAGHMIDAAKKELHKTYQPSRFAPRVLTGMSQGAFATYTLGLRYPGTFRRLIPVCGMFKPTSRELAQPFTEAEQNSMKRWRVYIMVGVKDKQELVSNNGWLANELNRNGAAVMAPFVNKHDPSWAMYQTIGHEFPGHGGERTAELTRALRFVLQPDGEDEKNWASVDRAWRTKAAWMQADSTSEAVGQPAPKDRPSR